MRFLSFVLVTLALSSPLAYAKRWEFGCKSFDGRYTFNRAGLNFLDGKKNIVALWNLNGNLDPTFADESAPLEFGPDLNNPARVFFSLANIVPGQSTAAKVLLNKDNKYCARNSRAYTATFRVVRGDRAEFVAFLCESAVFMGRVDAERCLWQPKVSLPAGK